METTRGYEPLNIGAENHTWFLCKSNMLLMTAHLFSTIYLLIYLCLFSSVVALYPMFLHPFVPCFFHLMLSPTFAESWYLIYYLCMLSRGLALLVSDCFMDSFGFLWPFHINFHNPPNLALRPGHHPSMQSLCRSFAPQFLEPASHLITYLRES